MVTLQTLESSVSSDSGASGDPMVCMVVKFFKVYLVTHRHFAIEILFHEQLMKITLF